MVADAETGARQGPIDCLLFTDDPATAALEASFERKHNLSVEHIEASGRTGIDTTTIRAGQTYLFVDPHMGLTVDIIFVDSQFIFDLHSACPPRIISITTCQSVVFPFIDSLRSGKSFVRGLPSLVKKLMGKVAGHIGIRRVDTLVF